MLACKAQQNGFGTLCNVTLKAPRRMAAPVFVYYELDNFYQNHRRCAQRSAEASKQGVWESVTIGGSTLGAKR